MEYRLAKISDIYAEPDLKTPYPDVFTENPYAQKLYRKSGYQVRGYADWRKGRFDLMEKKLETDKYA